MPHASAANLNVIPLLAFAFSLSLSIPPLFVCLSVGDLVLLYLFAHAEKHK